MKEVAQILFCGLLLLSMVETEARDYLNVGDQMSVNQTRASDKGGLFELGFWNPTGSPDKYYLAIWFVFNKFSPDGHAITWSVSTPCHVSSCKLVLTRDSGLVIHGTNWSAGANVESLMKAKITDDGNLIVYTRNRTTVWNSFDYPSNTLVSGQILKSGQSLYSWKSSDDPRSGNFFLRMEDRGLVLYGPPDYQYIYFVIQICRSSEPPVAVLDSSGSFNIRGYDEKGFLYRLAFDCTRYHGNRSLHRRMSLDNDGNFSMYTWHTDNKVWITSWTYSALIASAPSPSQYQSPPPVADTPTANPRKERRRILISSFVGGLAFAFAALSVFMWARRRKARNSQPFKNVGSAPVRFGYKELKMATNNFREKLGGGGFGAVYKGILHCNTPVAVKKLDSISQGDKEFEAEVMTIGSIHHVNLVRLIGFCVEGKHRRLLVYEFMENRSLDQHLFTTISVLPWSARFNIALGVARGMAYYHDHCRSRIVHCDLKPQNILLDQHLQPKISDFGLAKLMSKDESCTLTMARGTRGYLAPEWLTDVPITVKADVYSYGQMVLEIIGGRKNLDLMETVSPDIKYYPDWAFKELTQRNIAGLADARLGTDVDLKQVDLLMKVAFWCIQGDANSRPSMTAVVHMIEGLTEVLMPPRPKNLLFQVNFSLGSAVSS